MSGRSSTLPLKQHLERSKIKEKHLVQLADELLNYIAGAEHDPDLMKEPDIMLQVEDTKRFYFLLTGTWWKDAL